MASNKRQFLNLYAPGNAAATRFTVEQKAEEAFFSREDKKIRFYAPDVVFRKKKTLVIDEEDVSLFDEFAAQKAEYTAFNDARAGDHGALVTTVSQLSGTVVSNKATADGQNNAEITARTNADNAIVATASANKVEYTGFNTAQTDALAAEKATLVGLINAEADARAAKDTLQDQAVSALLSNLSTSEIDSIAEIITEMSNLSAEDSNLAGLIASQGAAITVL